jgi:hypothetical protein
MDVTLGLWHLTKNVRTLTTFEIRVLRRVFESEWEELRAYGENYTESYTKYFYI